MNVVFCASEVFPFAKTGGLADVCGSLPIALEHSGAKVSVFMPFYKAVDRQEIPLEKVGPDVLKSKLGKNIDVYFIIHDYFYKRDGIYNDHRGDYNDNFDRYEYFCKRTLELIKALQIPVDVIHCHDWQTALIPVYLKERYCWDEHFRKTKTVLTIHNLAYQGVFSAQKYAKLGLRPELFNFKIFEFYGNINLLKAGIVYADEITTVSPQYAKEIQTEAFGYRLHNVLSSNKNKVVGVLNGLDYQIWDPAKDDFLIKKYTPENYKEGKLQNKKFLQERFGMEKRPEAALIGFVGRLAGQKGIDLLLSAADEIMKQDVQVVVQGLGQRDYIDRLSHLSYKYRGRWANHFHFDEQMAHGIYSGCDFFLMPSLFEPCGLSQMIAFKYGSPPIVFKTGGLIDTVVPFDLETKKGNGFFFEKSHPGDFIGQIYKAVEIFKNQPAEFEILVRNAFQSEFPWDDSAKHYLEIYQCLMSA